jgi:hypothetical protein
VVDPDERTATAGITNVARTAATTISPIFSGIAFSFAAFGLPFFISGALKCIYDGLIYAAFKDVHPPEEVARREARAARDAAKATG